MEINLDFSGNVVNLLPSKLKKEKMLKNRIIPCLDVKNGRVVKGINFVELKDAGDPVEQAKIYSEGGADEICFLDITASNENRDTILDVVKKTSQECFVPLTVGGGVRNITDISNLLKSGADKVSINTAAVNNKNIIKDSAKNFGSQCIVIAIDAKKISEKKWEVFTHGGRKSTGQRRSQLCKRSEELGAGEILLTSMDRDGTKKGYDLELTELFLIPLIFQLLHLEVLENLIIYMMVLKKAKQALHWLHLYFILVNFQ